ncbi:MAG: hypothetical protein HN742_31385 [Lentisphaerae bacterium]|jgi:hypothetical protein|nr:hypothetical protein [Lentisphaerota bacterium]MBT4817341.1 hypothetical protein [Lentisphaerota bacterium]MBT5612950.1 hypothetical protein [Lentisphaerota bacterium]MBT7059028.1 hypothetical protein [Lentisphaerota bacterium]MBT7846415.1 hypothetical protein [Lentisphaerota bacterium]
MRSSRYYWTAVCLLAMPCGHIPGQEEAPKMRLRPEIREDVVGCGLYQLSGYDDHLDGLACPDLSGHKLMKRWSALEPQEGVHDWTVLDRPIQKIGAAGKRFMISPIIPDGGVPQWVFDAGATWITKLEGAYPVDGTNFYVDVVAGGQVKAAFQNLHRELKWRSHSMDLTSLAGQNVVLRLSTDCGKRAYYDNALWGRPRIVAASTRSGALTEAADDVKVVSNLQQACDSANVYIVVDGERRPLGQRAQFGTCSDRPCGGIAQPSIYMHPPWNDADGRAGEPKVKRVVAEFAVELPKKTPNSSLLFTFELGIRDLPSGRAYRYQTPVYWHPVLREKYKQFIMALGRRYDGEPGLELVYVGTGTYGETIISPDLWKGWDTEKAEEWRQAGLTHDAWVAYVNEIVDTYVAAFPRTPVGLQISGSGLPNNARAARAVAEHAATKRVEVQYDGATGQPFQWGGEMYITLLKPLSSQTSWGLETYGPSPGAGGGRWQGDFGDFVDCIAKHVPNYALVWYQDVVKATPELEGHDPEWAQHMRRCLESVSPGPSTHIPAKDMPENTLPAKP